MERARGSPCHMHSCPQHGWVGLYSEYRVFLLTAHCHFPSPDSLSFSQEVNSHVIHIFAMETHQRFDMFCDVSVFGGRNVGKREWTKRIRSVADTSQQIGSTYFTVKGPCWTNYFTLKIYQHSQWVTDATSRYILIFDLTNQSSLLNEIDGFMELISGRDDKRGAMLLIGNKVDAVRPGDEEVDATRRMARRFAEEGGLVYVETSALTGEGVVEAAYLLVNIDTQQPLESRLKGVVLPEGWFVDSSMPLPL